MFDDDLEVCGACGVVKQRHEQACDPADLARVAELDKQLDLEFEAFVDLAEA